MLFSSYFRSKQKAQDDDSEIRQLRLYLLGEVDESQQSEIESRYFRDPAYYEKMLLQEDELIRSYFTGAMSTWEEMLFEKHFLRSDRRRKKVEFLLSQFQGTWIPERRSVAG